jgi:hypothetical protein
LTSVILLPMMKRRMAGIEHGTIVFNERLPMYFAMTALVEGEFTAVELKAALKKVQETHVLARVHVELDGMGNPWLVEEGTEEIPVRVTDRQSDSDWTRVIPEEVIVRFPYAANPLFRMVWIRGKGVSELMLICHHALIDGLSGAVFMKDLVTHLGDEKAPVRPVPEMPPIEDLMPESVEAWFRDKNGDSLKRMREKFAGLSAPAAPGPLADFSAYKFHVNAWSLDRELTSALIARARAEKSTVHAGIGAAFLRAFYKVVGKEDEFIRAIQSPVSLRKLLTVDPGQYFGYFITIIKARIDCGDGRPFWDIARDINTRFAEEIGSRGFSIGIYGSSR